MPHVYHMLWKAEGARADPEVRTHFLTLRSPDGARRLPAYTVKAADDRDVSKGHLADFTRPTTRLRALYSSASAHQMSPMPELSARWRQSYSIE